MPIVQPVLNHGTSGLNSGAVQNCAELRSACRLVWGQPILVLPLAE